MIELHRIETCTFKREKDSTYEKGLLLNEGELGIIDMNGNKVSEVWNWERSSFLAVELTGWEI